MSISLQDPRIDWAFLKSYRFDQEIFEKLSQEITKGTLSVSSAIFSGSIEPVDSVVEVDWENNEHLEAGLHALRNGEVALFVLNGGMATRFGNVVKTSISLCPSKLAFKASTKALTRNDPAERSGAK